MKIYIVEGRTGEYSDRIEWPVKAFKRKARADALCKRLHKVAKAWTGGYGILERDKLRLLLQDTGDPHASVDYTGTSYGVYELELE